MISFSKFKRLYLQLFRILKLQILIRLLNQQKFRLSLKFDDNYKESIEPLNKALHRNFSLILTKLIFLEIFFLFHDRKTILKDFELFFKEHKSIEVKSPISFKQQKQPYLESAQFFDELLLRTLKVMKHIQQYSTYSMQVAVYYNEFQYYFNGSIKVNQEKKGTYSYFNLILLK
ncbi:unnamed protein product [Paramecium sonneborni]|uniref:Uncharacterized protein n=1 Tax=Paramecium sonneborni TaxID=65129 RepID=A0A8S1LW13_9CILI|nr:unnamed protein product [Paramecium sonneborni]